MKRLISSSIAHGSLLMTHSSSPITHHSLLITLFVLIALSSCIEEFNDLPASVGEPQLVVEGEIVSGQNCLFTLRQSATLEDVSNFHYQNSLKPVIGSLQLDCSDGTSYYSVPSRNKGFYTIQVPDLEPDKTYTLHVKTDNMGDYHTEPMKPLYAPGIDSFTYEMPNNDGQIHFSVSTADPNGAFYVMWRYDEYYEVCTPIYCMWEYDVENRELYVRDFPTNQGWISVTSNEISTASNEAYGNHAIVGYNLYQRNKQELRFRTKYMSIVKQAAISVDEYEYYRLLRIQSTNVGGIFSAMPSELPSNLKTDDGKKAIGYIGVRGSLSQKSLVITPKEIGYKDMMVPEKPEPDKVEKDPAIMIDRGWVIANYGPSGIEWTKPWCVDCRTHFWDGGASLEKPSVWPF